METLAEDFECRAATNEIDRACSESAKRSHEPTPPHKDSGAPRSVPKRVRPGLFPIGSLPVDEAGLPEFQADQHKCLLLIVNELP